ncbi:hypothetical protein ACQCSV_19000 [Pseudarthrobacter sp. S3]|uniref:hypothetical protein n=1 Tax=Pseudarthrobacter sp. S3 TaxID=3418419 RepID=UPI003CFAB4BC
MRERTVEALPGRASTVRSRYGPWCPRAAEKICGGGPGPRGQVREDPAHHGREQRLAFDTQGEAGKT